MRNFIGNLLILGNIRFVINAIRILIALPEFPAGHERDFLSIYMEILIQIHLKNLQAKYVSRECFINPIQSFKIASVEAIVVQIHTAKEPARLSQDFIERHAWLCTDKAVDVRSSAPLCQ